MESSRAMVEVGLVVKTERATRRTRHKQRKGGLGCVSMGSVFSRLVGAYFKLGSSYRQFMVLSQGGKSRLETKKAPE